MFISFIVKVSKLCNLRCKYCYETEHLSDHRFMPLSKIEIMFERVQSMLAENKNDFKKSQIEFIWHGGEPFARPLKYWEGILEAQDRIFGKKIRKRSISNCIQTNTTLLTQSHIRLLKKFSVGCSFDVVNDYRVTTTSKPTAECVREKINWLIKEEIDPGAIAVISKANIDYPQEVASFFLDRGMNFRLLNIYEAIDELEGTRNARVSFERYLDFCFKVYSMPEVRNALEAGVAIEPFSQAITLLNMSTQKRLRTFSDCSKREWSLSVNTNGDVYSPGDIYKPEWKYGNIFKDSMDDLLDSPTREMRIRRSEKRLKAICEKSCFLFRRGCLGTFVSHATPESYRYYLKTKGCEHSIIAKHILRSLQSEKKETLNASTICDE